MVPPAITELLYRNSQRTELLRDQVHSQSATLSSWRERLMIITQTRMAGSFRSLQDLQLNLLVIVFRLKHLSISIIQRPLHTETSSLLAIISLINPAATGHFLAASKGKDHFFPTNKR